MQLVRVNSRRIGGYDSIDSATYSDSFSQWPSIGEDTSLGMEALQIAQIDTQITEPREPLETDLEEVRRKRFGVLRFVCRHHQVQK